MYLKISKRKYRLISILMAVMLLLTAFPVYATESAQPEIMTETPADVSTGTTSFPISYVTEDVLPETIELHTALKGKHVKRMYTLEETLNTAVFRNEDGTSTVYYFDGDIKYVDKDGNVKDKSNKLTKIIGGYTNSNNDINVFYPDVLANGITTTYKDYSITVSPGSFDTSLTNKLNTQVNASKIPSEKRTAPDTVSYSGIYGTDTVITYTQNFEGYKENIILNKDIDQTRFPFIVKTNGLKLEENSGELDIIDPTTNEKVGCFGKLLMWDSNGKQVYGEYEIIPVKDNEIYGIVINAEALLNLPDIVYPVTIDPTVSLNYGQYSGIIDNTIFYNNPSVQAGDLQSVIVGADSRGTARSLIKLPGIIGDSSFIDRVLNNTVVRVTYNMTCMGNPHPDDWVVYVYPCTSWWSESSTYSSALWNAIPDQSMTSMCIEYATSSSVIGCSFDLDMNLINDWVGNDWDGNGVMLVSLGEDTADPLVFGSMESGAPGKPGLTSWRPYVTYTYNDIVEPGRVNEEYFTITSNTYGTLLTVEDGFDVNDTPVQLSYSTNYSISQEFVFTSIIGDYSHYYISAACSKSGRGRVLGANSSETTSSIFITPLDYNTSLKFKILSLDYQVGVNDSRYSFVTDTNMALTANSDGSVSITPYSTYNSAQIWIVESAILSNLKREHYAGLNVGYPLTEPVGDNVPDDTGLGSRNLHITSGFGWRKLEGVDNFHSGMDIWSTLGETVFSVCSGTVKVIAEEPVGPGSRGKYIVIEADDLYVYGSNNDQNLCFAYLHLNSFNSNIYQGCHVEQGQPIGTVGYSGMESVGATHLHFEMVIDGGSGGGRNSSADPILLYPNVKFTFGHNRGEADS